HRRTRGLCEPNVLSEVGGAQHSSLADHRHLTTLLGGQPVDVEQALGTFVAEAEQAGDHVLLGGVYAAASFSVDARDVATQDELHEIQVVSGQVDRHASVLNAQGQR